MLTRERSHLVENMYTTVLAESLMRGLAVEDVIGEIFLALDYALVLVRVDPDIATLGFRCQLSFARRQWQY